MNMTVANDTVSRKGNVPATNVTNDDGTVVLSRVSREPVSIDANPIVIFDACFYTTVFGKLDSHLAKEFPWVLEEFQIFLDGAFPKMEIPRLLSDDFGPS
jgi:hypothetical protein